MALIACPECGREVSDKAPTCPGCGAPIAGAVTAGPAPVTTIQATGQDLKSHLVGAVLVFFIGLLYMLFNISSNPVLAYGAGAASLAALFWAVVTKIRMWERHG